MERLFSWKTNYLEFMELLDLVFTTSEILHLALPRYLTLACFYEVVDAVISLGACEWTTRLHRI
jgi:hypothetical protein